MPTLAIYVKDHTSVLDIFGEYFARIKRWAEKFLLQEEVDDSDEPHETDDFPEGGLDPPSLGISVNDGVKSNDTFGKR